MNKTILYACLFALAGCNSEVIPSSTPINKKMSLSCTGVATTEISAKDYSSNKDQPKYEIKADSKPEKADRLAIQIHDDRKHIDVMTALGVETGSMKPVTYTVTDDAPSLIIALATDGIKLESLSINLDSGIAIWSKVRAHGLIARDLPDQFTTLLSCQ
jgi:hypothetical protein